MKSKKFQQNKAMSAALLEWARQSEQADVQDLISGECRIAREQAALQAAWDELQATPSYCEQQTAAFAKEYNHDTE